ncbi:MAG: hypothetical protein SVY10_09630 [Thermodesulfobacteriota bacterium]|nr:hypothetical protein [Thermodesulfobacteriota bacterium]
MILVVRALFQCPDILDAVDQPVKIIKELIRIFQALVVLHNSLEDIF